MTALPGAVIAGSLELKSPARAGILSNENAILRQSIALNRLPTNRDSIKDTAFYQHADHTHLGDRQINVGQ
jgi:hypothetical protein